MIVGYIWGKRYTRVEGKSPKRRCSKPFEAEECSLQCLHAHRWHYHRGHGGRTGQGMMSFRLTMNLHC